MQRIQELLNGYYDWLWQSQSAETPFWTRNLRSLLRITYAVIRDIQEGMPTLRAMSLVYTTLLSLVPLIAVSFSVLKGFGYHNQAEPMLLNLLAPLGEQGVEITQRIMRFVDNIKAGVLGSVGLAVLLYTVVGLIQKIEKTLNHTWHVKQHRSLTLRFSSYLAVILIGPVLVFSSIGLTATMMSTTLMQQLITLQPFGWLFALFDQVIPYLLIIIAFTTIYIFLPNTKVRTRSALIGAIVGGLLWELCGWIFTSFIVTSTNYTAIYSAFAALILFIVWLYLAWMILLIGSSIAFYHQHPEHQRYSERSLQLNNYDTERVTLLILRLIAHSHYHQLPGWSIPRLARHLALPESAIHPLTDNLISTGAFTLTKDNDLIPARPMDQVALHQLIGSIRQSRQSPLHPKNHRDDLEVVDHYLSAMEQGIEDALEKTTLQDLALENVTGNNRPHNNN